MPPAVIPQEEVEVNVEVKEDRKIFISSNRYRPI
jgi:hypothetical protein